MKTVNIAELKNKLSAYLNEVRAGGEILVRDRGTPIARIVPLAGDPSGDAELLRLEAEGKIRIGSGAIEDAFWELPAPRIATEILLRALERDRDDGAP